ncbi:MAG TPA: SRPBCC family protein [Ilumatobacter sp.]
MRTSESVVVPAAAHDLFPYVSRLEAYPPWLRLVHRAALVAEEPLPTWDVELRARVGPFARSKRLRMQRVDIESNRGARFERAEVDGREHAMWALRVELAPSGDETVLTMHLAYDGKLWTGGVLERVLDDEVRRARVRLVELLSPTP